MYITAFFLFIVVKSRVNEMEAEKYISHLLDHVFFILPLPMIEGNHAN